jgi:hypothetical protein
VRRLLLPVLAVLALAAASCGGDEGGGAQEANDLLERGFSTDVDSGKISMAMELELEGGEGVNGVFRLELRGPFRSRGPTQVPDADLEFEAAGQGVKLEGGLVLLPENAWIEFGGETYELGEELWSSVQESASTGEGSDPFGEANIKPLDWITGAETEEGEEMSGTETTKVTGQLDLTAMLSDFNRLPPQDAAIPPETLDQIDEAIGGVEFEAWIGDDDIWRRVASKTKFTIPEAQRAAVGGVEGGRVSLNMTLGAPNEEVSIESPGPGSPISDLLRNFGIAPESLLGPGFEAPAPG